VVQHAWLAVVREAELSAVECFPIVLAGRYGSGAAALRIHLAISPPFLSSGWQGTLCLRAGAQRLDSSRIPVRLWLGPPASPEAAWARSFSPMDRCFRRRRVSAGWRGTPPPRIGWDAPSTSSRRAGNSRLRCRRLAPAP